MNRQIRRAGSLTGAGLLGLSVLGSAVVVLVRSSSLQERSARLMGLSGMSSTVALGCAAVGLLGAALVLSAGRSRWLSVIALVSCVLAAQLNAPTLAGLVAPERSQDGAPLTVLVQNLWYRNPDLTRVARATLDRDASVVVLLEFTPEAEKAFRDAGAARRYEYRWEQPRAFGHGIAVLSKVPFDVPVDLGLSGPSARLDLQLGGAPVVFYAVHVNSPSSIYDLPRWQADFAQLDRSVADAGPRTIVAGDLNATAGHRRFRLLLQTGDLRDAQDVGGGGFSDTWPADSWIPALLRIDHVLVGPEIGVEAFRTLPFVGSDHLGIEAGLRVPDR